MTEILYYRIQGNDSIDRGPLWQKLVDVALRLNTATELLNERLRDAEDVMHEQHVLPCSAKFPDGRALVWDGETLWVCELRGDVVLKRELLTTTRATRLAAVDVLLLLKIERL